MTGLVANTFVVACLIAVRNQRPMCNQRIVAVVESRKDAERRRGQGHQSAAAAAFHR